MKRGRCWVVLAVAACGLLSFAGAALASAAEPAAAAYGIGVDIAPDPEEDGTYEARAIVMDLKTEEVLSAPRIRFAGGPDGRAQIRSGIHGGLSVHMEIEVDELGETAIYKAEIRRGETLVALHKARIQLAARETNE